MVDVVVEGERAGHAAALDDLLQRALTGGHHLGVIQLSNQAHRRGQVTGSDEEHIDVVDFEDLVQVVDRHDVLDQHDEHCLVVGVVEVVLDTVTLAAGEQAALSDGGKLAAGDDVFGFGFRVDVRNDDSLYTPVQCAVDDRLLVLVDSHDRRHAPQIAGSRQVADVPKVNRPVFSFEPDGIEAGGSEAVDVLRIGQSRYAADGLAGGELVFGLIGSQGHGVLLGV